MDGAQGFYRVLSWLDCLDPGLIPPPRYKCYKPMCSSFHQGSVGKGKSGVSKGSAASSGAKGDKDDESGLPYAVTFLAGVSEIPITSM